jgi:hypothetical protein
MAAAMEGRRCGPPTCTSSARAHLPNS